MKINRLFEIVYILLDKEKVTAKELAEHFEVSTRTIYRDVEDLSAGGIPIYMSKGRNGGISLLPDYLLNKMLLSESEKINILSAIQSLNALDDSMMDDLLSKLSSFFGNNNTGYFEIDYTDWNDLLKDSFKQAKQAILSRNCLSFDYISSLNNKSRRTVEPYKLWFKQHTWYLKAFCLDRNEARIFRFSRMRNVEIIDESFVPREIDFNTLMHETHFSTTEIILKIDSRAMYRVLDEFSDKNIVQNQDGSFTVTLNMIEDEWVYGYILSFGELATVIRPKRIRDIIQRKIKKNLRNYRKREGGSQG
ncbi:MAG: YafY family protein [Gallicola sp.]|nr:YafY family protein [Gallicola sp.]